jgi:phage shock protein A
MAMLGRIGLVLRARVSALLDRAEDPRQTLDYAYAQQQELLRQARQGVIEVATSRCLLEQQARRLGEQVSRSGHQAARALAAGREDLARAALQLRQAAQAELAQLELRLAEVVAEERKLGQATHQLATRVEESRLRRASLVARYTAAEAHTRVMESLAGVSHELAQLGTAIGRAEERIERMQARATALDALVGSGWLSIQGATLDGIERELRTLSSTEAVEQELAALRGRLVEPPAVPSATRPAWHETEQEAT